MPSPRATEVPAAGGQRCLWTEERNRGQVGELLVPAALAVTLCGSWARSGPCWPSSIQTGHAGARTVLPTLSSFTQSPAVPTYVLAPPVGTQRTRSRDCASAESSCLPEAVLLGALSLSYKEKREFGCQRQTGGKLRRAILGAEIPGARRGARLLLG